MISIRGITIEQTNEGADEHIDKLAKKYQGVDKYPMRSPDEKKNYSKNKTKFIRLNISLIGDSNITMKQ